MKRLVPIFIVLCIIATGCNNQPVLENQQPGQTEGKQAMEPTICERHAFTVMGTSTRMSPSEETGENYTKIWSDFERYNEQLKQLSIDRKYYGVTFPTQQQNLIDYVTAMAVPDRSEPVAEGLVVRTVPAAQYAVFECPVEKIGRTYQYIMGQWLPASQYSINPSAASFEEYPPEGQGDLPVCIYIPVSEKPGQ
jgi:predicted transcriptional regulator YdeE